jgi:hypothetical protein
MIVPPPPDCAAESVPKAPETTEGSLQHHAIARTAEWLSENGKHAGIYNFEYDYVTVGPDPEQEG